jgi:ArsR family metal-binding transcriptional regulator
MTRKIYLKMVATIKPPLTAVLAAIANFVVKSAYVSQEILSLTENNRLRSSLPTPSG